MTCGVLDPGTVGTVPVGQKHSIDQYVDKDASGTSLCVTPKRRRLDFDIESIATPAKVSRTLERPAVRPAVVTDSNEGCAAGKVRKTPLKVNGPLAMQTLRGRLHGREVALVLCGEAHEVNVKDAIDLTRSRGVVAASEGWIAVQGDCRKFDPDQAFASKGRLSLRGAQRWASELLADTDEDVVVTGAVLVFEPKSRKRGVATVFLPKQIGTGKRQALPSPSASIFEFGDLDEEARAFNRRRLEPEERLSVEEQDLLIRQRKEKRRAEGFELFDDWLLHQVGSKDVHVEVILEAPVRAEELELFVAPGEASAPVAHERLQAIGLDAEEDAEEAATPGAGSYLDFLRRRLLSELPASRVHCVDARGLGDAEDEHLPPYLRGSYDRLKGSAPPRSQEEALLAAAGDRAEFKDEPLPSWEAFFGGAADLLYYAHHVKADYAPFLKQCVGSADNMRRFFQALFFDTVPDAVSMLRLNEETRRCLHVRSQLCVAETGEVQRRPPGVCASGRRTIPVRAAPVDRFLAARGFQEPRTWLSGIAERLRSRGAGDIVTAAKVWYQTAVNKMLADPKGADAEGDNFVAWLRACHGKIFSDIDTHDPVKLRRKQFAPSKSKPKRYNLRDINIPSVEEAFKEFCKSRRSTAREQVLSKIMVDIFQLRSVDLAMVLKAAEAALSAPKGAKVALFFYAGLDHTRSVARFFKKIGFSSSGLPKHGVVGKEEYEEDEKRALSLPSYLNDLSKLFPVPASLPEVDKRLRRPRNSGAKISGGKRSKSCRSERPGMGLR